MKKFILALLLGTSGYASAEYGCDHHWEMYKKLKGESEIGRMGAFVAAGAVSMLCPACAVLSVAVGGVTGAISYKIFDDQSDEHLNKYKKCVFKAKREAIERLDKESAEANRRRSELQAEEEEEQRRRNKRDLEQFEQSVRSISGVAGPIYR